MAAKFIVLFATIIVANANVGHLSHGYDPAQFGTNKISTHYSSAPQVSQVYNSVASPAQYSAAAGSIHKNVEYVGAGHSTYYNNVQQPQYYQQNYAAPAHYSVAPASHTVAYTSGPSVQHHNVAVIPAKASQYYHTSSPSVAVSNGDHHQHYTSVAAATPVYQQHSVRQPQPYQHSAVHQPQQYQHSVHQPQQYIHAAPAVHQQYAHAAPTVAHHKTVVSYSPASEVSHTTFEGTNAHYSW